MSKILVATTAIAGAVASTAAQALHVTLLINGCTLQNDRLLCLLDAHHTQVLTAAA